MHSYIFIIIKRWLTLIYYIWYKSYRSESSSSARDALLLGFPFYLSHPAIAACLFQIIGSPSRGTTHVTRSGKVWSAHFHFNLISYVNHVINRLRWFFIMNLIRQRDSEHSTLNLSIIFTVSAHIFEKSIITGATHWLKTFIFKHCSIGKAKTKFSKPCSAQLNAPVVIFFEVVLT